jgi:hypothetical protein
MAHTRYKLNLNYAMMIKHDIDKLLVTRFIQLVEEAICLSLVVVVLKKNGKLRMRVDFKKFNKATKKNLYPLPFFDEVLNIVTRYKTYSFIDGHIGYH